MARLTKDEIDKVVQGQTVSSRFRDVVGAHGDAIALRWRNADETWGATTYGEYGDQACRVATGLSQLGLTRGDRLVLLMRNRPEFHVADMAGLLCGATVFSIYSSSSPEQIEYLANHSEASVAIVEDIGFLERLLKVRAELPNLRHVIILEDPDGLAPDDVVAYSTLLDNSPVDIDLAASVAQPEDLATIIYTSGTTGPPKGVMLSHYNIVFTAEGYVSLLDRELVGFRALSYLPMAHIAERMSSYYLGILGGLDVTTCPDAGLLSQYLPHVRPQTFFGVPRVWEKLHAGVMAAVSGDAEKLKQFEGAIAAGHEETLAGVRQLLGLDAAEIAVTGAAPIPVEIFNWFRSIGVPLSEIYGMSESTGPITWDAYEVRPGTVGRNFPGCEVKLLDDGEVVCRGGNVFLGYLKDPDKTAEALDDDGWLHTGDIGAFDDDGYLKIVDRKKELIITAGGKNISPANIEAALKSFELIGQACVIGDNKPFISALLVLDSEVAPAWAKQHGVDASGGMAALASDPTVLEEIEREVKEANQRFSQVERVKKWTLLHDEWQPDSDELTPTMKLKRRGIHAKYAPEIDAIYGG
ncbi:MAG TPA: AMP-dependent synthetase/ligase [Acidimicrobiales bacterium]|nr:AMP-dependent synthetase/ligase [Acidimicrobiales bacterium]